MRLRHLYVRRHDLSTERNTFHLVPYIGYTQFGTCYTLLYTAYKGLAVIHSYTHPLYTVGYLAAQHCHSTVVSGGGGRRGPRCEPKRTSMSAGNPDRASRGKGKATAGETNANALVRLQNVESDSDLDAPRPKLGLDTLFHAQTYHF